LIEGVKLATKNPSPSGEKGNRGRRDYERGRKGANKRPFYSQGKKQAQFWWEGPLEGEVNRGPDF